MVIRKAKNTGSMRQNLESSSLNYQLDILKIELAVTQDTIIKILEFTQTTKNWAIGIWAGSIALLLGQQTDLSKYVIFTAILPLSFWYVDAHWRRIQRRITYRQTKIREFLNSSSLLRSFKNKKVVDFEVYDPTGNTYRGIPDAEKTSSLWRTFRYPELLWFYLPMILISVSAGMVFLFLVK
ncbi:MAG TPA: hypothetical protein PKE62_03165 [Anaerolineales bacterium]|nr:hypothetical protein [Anaerolineales bacterium]